MNFYKIDSRHKVTQVLDNLALNLIDNWNFEKPVQILFKEYKNPRTLSQNALVHVWFAEIAKAMKLKGFTYTHCEHEYHCDLHSASDDEIDNGDVVCNCDPTVEQRYLSDDDIKLMLKHKFLGVKDIVRGKLVIKDQLVSTKKLDKGEMMRFLDEVYGWAFDRGIQLKTPEDSEYMKLRRKQDA